MGDATMTFREVVASINRLCDEQDLDDARYLDPESDQYHDDVDGMDDEDNEDPDSDN